MATYPRTQTNTYKHSHTNKPHTAGVQLVGHTSINYPVHWGNTADTLSPGVRSSVSRAQPCQFLYIAQPLSCWRSVPNQPHVQTISASSSWRSPAAFHKHTSQCAIQPTLMCISTTVVGPVSGATHLQRVTTCDSLQ